MNILFSEEGKPINDFKAREFVLENINHSVHVSTRNVFYVISELVMNPYNDITRDDFIINYDNGEEIIDVEIDYLGAYKPHMRDIVDEEIGKVIEHRYQYFKDKED